MRRFELGMSLDYASSWGVAEGVREFFQNALDEEKENPENKMSFFYNVEEGTISISNAKSKLTPKSLLMGSSTKRGNANLIGEHGEGYKVATVVLLRNGVTVRIYNNESNEVWESRIVRSKRYESDIVCFDIRKEIFNKKDNLVVELSGITPEMYEDIVKKNLWLQDSVGEERRGDYGSVLLDKRYSGDLFVEGLFVCHNPNIRWGYNLNANLVSLDRDRGLVDTFDLKFALAKAIAGLHDPEFVVENISNPDLLFISNYKDMVLGRNESVEEKRDLSDMALERFLDENGADAVPVASSNDFNYYASIGARPVMVESQEAELIFSKPRKFTETCEISNEELKRRINTWWENTMFMLTDRQKNEFNVLLKELNKRL